MGAAAAVPLPVPLPGAEDAELSSYFKEKYLNGELFEGSSYAKSSLSEIATYTFKGADGETQVWQHAFDLRAFGNEGEDLIILYHYTNELGFRNVGDLKQSAAQLFASLADDRAHFGQGVYTTQHEPAVCGMRVRILLNNYSNEDPLRPDTNDAESQRVDREWGSGKADGHRAAFCVPLIVPKSIAYNIFERQTPDMAKRNLSLGEDYKGRAVHGNRDVWVVRLADERGSAHDAVAEADAVLKLLRLRLEKLRLELGDDHASTLGCMSELVADRSASVLSRAFQSPRARRGHDTWLLKI
ncbi:unnamed protein product [Effrenium voratum]|uniref:Uncharacterized protein n=1 Tax=Effrenium voratum TaxID=2562239 RepID=A0AA36NDR7_9DINO|nr:unnamed protein product [Effrenium voratum]CAJ1449037.1 unnamed protein product [Effrenium voratum]